MSLYWIRPWVKTKLKPFEQIQEFRVKSNSIGAINSKLIKRKLISASPAQATQPIFE